MRRYLALLLCAVMVFALAACSASDAGGDPTGSTANGAENVPGQTDFPSTPSAGLEISLNEAADAYIVTGMGECIDLFVVIPDSVDGIPVTAVEDSAFYCNESIRGVKMGKHITAVGDFAFFGCTSLERVSLGDAMVSLGRYAFAGCNLLTTITIPDSVETVGEWAFFDCISLNEVHISDLDQWLGISFGDIYANPLMIAGNLYLDGNLVTAVTIPESVTTIKAWTFAGCKSLTQVQLHENVTEIGQRAFLDCENIERVIYPGTHEQWKLVILGTYWDFSIEEFVIVCQDKEIKG